MRLTRRITAAIAAVFTLGVLVPAAWAQPPTILIHADLDALRQQAAGSGLEQAWNDPQVQQARNQLLDLLATQMSGQGGGDPRPLIDRLRGQAGLVMTISPPPPGQYSSVTHGAIGLYQPGELDATLTALTNALGPNGTLNLQQISVRQGDAIAFGDDPTLTSQLAQRMAGGAQGLGLSPSPGAFLTASFAIQALLDADPPSETERRDQTELGIRSINSLDVSMALAGGQLVTDAQLRFAGQPVGLFSLVGPARPFSGLNLVPANAMACAGLRTIPPPEMWDWFVGAMQRSSPGDVQDVQEFNTSVQTRLGRDFRTGVLGSLTGEVVAVFNGLFGMTPDLAFIAGMTDTSVVDGFVDLIVEEANAGTTPPRLQVAPLTAGHLSGRMITGANMPFPICYVTSDNAVIVGTSQGVMTAVAQTVTTGQSILGSSSIQPVMSQLDPACSGFVISDRVGLAQLLLQNLPAMLQGAPPEVQGLLTSLNPLVPMCGAQAATIQTSSDALTLHSINSSGAEYIGLGTAAMLARRAAAPPPPSPTTTPN
jgi:hypothetical protein